MIVTGTGGGLPAELLHSIEELGTQLEREHRQAARHEAATALRQGLKEAEDLRSAASKGKWGAALGGAMTSLGGAAQLGAGIAMKTSPDAAGKLGLAKLEAHNGKAGQFGQFGGTLAQGGAIMERGFGEAAKMDEADSREAAARAEAAARQAESEQSAADSAKRSVDKARDTYGQIIDLEHASVMAALRA
ncbi:MAG TPA: hypothetical protein VK524_15190 [Polyangiaceae bacterium]|nr:hypothetical protein [Polyangiaceae bacterium]